MEMKRKRSPSIGSEGAGLPHLVTHLTKSVSNSYNETTMMMMTQKKC